MEKTTNNKCIQINNYTYVTIPQTATVTVQPPLADIPVEITVYTVNESILTVRRVYVSKKVVNEVQEIGELNTKIEELTRIIEISESKSDMDNSTSRYETIIEDINNCYSKLRNLKTSFEQTLDNSNIEQSSKELPSEQYELQDIEPIKFIKTLENLRNQLKLGDKLQDEKIRTQFEDTVINHCIIDEEFHRKEEDLRQSSVLKVVGLSLLLIVINFILSRTLNLTELVSSANLPGTFNFFVTLSPFAVLGGISFIEYVQYEEKHGKLITDSAIKKGIILDILKKQISINMNQKVKTVVPNSLDYHPNPEVDYQLKSSTPLTKISIAEQKKQLQDLKNELLNSEASKTIDTFGKNNNPRVHRKVLTKKPE